MPSVVFDAAVSEIVLWGAKASAKACGSLGADLQYNTGMHGRHAFVVHLGFQCRAVIVGGWCKCGTLGPNWGQKVVREHVMKPETWVCLLFDYCFIF